MRTLYLAVTLALAATPALAQPPPQRIDPAVQALANGAQVLIDAYKQALGDIVARDVALACWEKTGKACEPPPVPAPKPDAK